MRWSELPKTRGVLNQLMTPPSRDNVTFDPAYTRPPPPPPRILRHPPLSGRRHNALQLAYEFGLIDSEYISPIWSAFHHFGVHFTISKYILPFRRAFHHFGVHFTFSGYISPFRRTFHHFGVHFTISECISPFRSAFYHFGVHFTSERVALHSKS
jgi:hypothetical protein